MKLHAAIVHVAVLLNLLQGIEISRVDWKFYENEDSDLVRKGVPEDVLFLY